MPPRNKGMPPNREDDASTEDVSGTEANEDPEVSAEEAWAAAEGYTPLAEIRSEGAVFMAFHPDSDDEDVGASYGGTFFADMSSFGPLESPSDEWGGQHDANDEEGGRGAHDRTDVTEDVDFRSVADQALRALEDEYAMTVHGTILPPPIENKASSALADQKVGAVAFPPRTSVPEPIFKDTPSETKATSYLDDYKKETPMIDTDAVRKAVDSIRLKHPRLAKNLNEWEEQRGVNDTSVVALAPKEHTIIPKTPLSAFWRQSPKAISATANLSRSATLAEAIHRLSCLKSERLVIHIVGADHVECISEDQQRTLFGPLVRWIGALENSPRHIVICLVGPNVPADAPNRPPLDLMPKTSSSLVSATASCYEGVYHEWIQQQENGSTGFWPADIVIAFNAGLWGYDEWVATIKVLCESSLAIPFISTAYTIEECEDDAEVIQNVVSLPAAKEAKRLWKAEANPFSSRQIRETKTAVSGRQYRENAAWQAWKLGG